MQKPVADPGMSLVTKLDVARLQEISRHFPGRWLQGYVRGKLKSDPVYAAAAKEIRMRPAPVFDIGCGIGLFSHYLKMAGDESEYLGIDLDAAKIRIAQQAARDNSGVSFKHLSCETLPPWQGHVVILDTLHYLTAATQQALLRAAAARVTPGAALIIRSVLRDDSWRFGITRFEELFMRSVRWMRYGVQHYPTADELRVPLADAGLSVHITPLWGRTPFNSYLIVARRASD
ncbi:MAG: class I SAM-dependent methyltransferase [Gammaproteobacteria bacterium]